MGFTFQGSDFIEFLASASLSEAEVSQQGIDDSGIMKFRTPKGQISYEEYPVNDSLSILQGSYQLNDDVTIYGRGESHLLEMHFNLSARDIYYHNKVIKREWAPAMSGNITFLSQEENQAKISFNKNISYQTFDVHLPLPMLTNYSGESLAMDDFLNSISRNQCGTLSAREVVISPKIYSAIHAIKNCIYEGLTKKIYLESKIYELIAFLHEGSEVDDKVYPLSNADIECIKHAAVLIRENLSHPLTIIELARKLGINQTKLKSGFKAIFGNTIFGYLQETRMYRARKFILDTNLSIHQISSLSGYNSISNFSTAFKQTYGYSPNKLRSRL
ncbi:AraC family transcriptional regulator [Pedobacter chinensis]|uniref:AraC family transcriptional regulator n=1 Tax=Pedobacter chinensis TaxID=2282421 RepID=A0A369PT29_9SPHI|nr:AraC family transcriptional regulator [Pedobacter chinensis]RDC55811.1 AraC family transcriptional regulator [Pedobacter chinensis]